ncbi:glycoside hydrolase family 3 N-terminal domain-containing protein [Ochrovirga pacifica]|uniref:glycoside hydrolase family 3 N-terminal domain-containing protein n=1 Tax=Ochrovirga pacifica TaxID=1042376 RepID=UPI000255872A|nr:glycoside hydrolase family 3 N-terminal domain-containing protein [Ochrovirga pacifica]
MKYLMAIFFWMSVCVNAFSQQFFSINNPLIAKDRFAQKIWVDSIMDAMTLDEKIGQLFMVQAYSNKDEKHEQEIVDLIKKHHIGGLIFMQGTPTNQVKLYNKYQNTSKVPLLVGFDGEWGLSMRIKPAFAYPWNMTLGAVQDNSLIYQVGKQIGLHCKQVGIHVNFAPVVDINTNPLNPIIGNRSFGEDRYNVTQKAKAFVEGMQSVGVLANAKHFPGHGDTAIDSHKTLPVLNFSKQRLDSLELYPYKQLVNSDLASVMVGHLLVPSLKVKENRPSSISKEVITDLLQKEIGFGGLVFTDALNMHGVAAYAAADLISLEAFKAGNDVLLFPMDVKNGIANIKKAIEQGEITEQRLNHSVKKIVQAKYLAKLHQTKIIATKGIEKNIHTVQDDLLYKKVAENAITLVKNQQDFLPIQRLDTVKIASVSLGDASSDTFVKTLHKYKDVQQIKELDSSNYKEKLAAFNTVVIGFHKSDEHPWKSYKMTPQEIELIKTIAAYKKVILAVFASPYALLQLQKIEGIDHVIVGYQNHAVFQSVAAQQIFGALPFLGKLPVSVFKKYKAGHGIVRGKLKRLKYGIPEEVGMDRQKLSKIDSVAELVIKKKMAPGLQVLVARKGTVIFEKAYGFFTYKKQQKVSLNSLYDLASLTKILGAMPLFLKGFDEGVYTLDQRLGTLLPEVENSNIDSLLVIDMLAHQSGLQAWIPFYLKTLDSITHKPNKQWYAQKKSKDYSVQVAEDLFLKKAYVDSVYTQIKNASLREERDYKYTDLTFILAKKVFENHYKAPMESLLKEFFTQHLGTNRLTYNPLNYFLKDSIVPSEEDDYYRNQTLQGHVHDMAAAMLGGVSGNAGLFGNANDVAKMMQLYLNNGFYGGKQFFRSNTFKVFNQVYFKTKDNRRALILDKPSLDGVVENTCNCTSKKSFGHSGFTGTFTWADPESELIYVFLSNRTYPTMKNNDLGKYNIRTNIQQLIQEAIVE